MKTDAELSTKGRQTRTEVLRAARTALVEGGYDAFVLRDIADRAGVKLGNLQYYYPTREDLLEAVFRFEFAAGVEAFEALAREKQDPEALLREEVRVLLESCTGDAGRIWIVLLFLSAHEERFREVRDETYQEYYRHLAGLIRRVSPKSGPEALLRKARLINTLIDGAFLQVHSGSAPRRRKSAKQLTDDIVRTVLDMVRDDARD